MFFDEGIIEWTQKKLKQMGYLLRFSDLTSGPITSIYLDSKHGSNCGGASNFDDEYGNGW
jgi:hypothetical protein